MSFAKTLATAFNYLASLARTSRQGHPLCGMEASLVAQQAQIQKINQEIGTLFLAIDKARTEPDLTVPVVPFVLATPSEPPRKVQTESRSVLARETLHRMNILTTEMENGLLGYNEWLNRALGYLLVAPTLEVGDTDPLAKAKIISEADFMAAMEASTQPLEFSPGEEVIVKASRNDLKGIEKGYINITAEQNGEVKYFVNTNKRNHWFTRAELEVRRD